MNPRIWNFDVHIYELLSRPSLHEELQIQSTWKMIYNEVFWVTNQLRKIENKIKWIKSISGMLQNSWASDVHHLKSWATDVHHLKSWAIDVHHLKIWTSDVHHLKSWVIVHHLKNWASDVDHLKIWTSDVHHLKSCTSDIYSIWRSNQWCTSFKKLSYDVHHLELS